MVSEGAMMYEALRARDRRFDGVFFVGVTSTGIYCRPVCTARTPRRDNCRFYASAAAAEGEGFRPCLRCRPELAPGSAPIDGGERLASRIVARISEGGFDGAAGIEQIASEFHLSARQLRRVVRAELGVSPIDLVLTRRLLLAKQLLTETGLPVIEVAYASGFSSLRRFNDAFLRRYGMPPTRLRRAAIGGAESEAGAGESRIVLRLAYRPPFAWNAILDFLRPRAVAGVEAVEGGVYRRTVQLGESRGWIVVRDEPERHTLRVELASALTPELPRLLARIRRLFDLEARPDRIAEHLSRDPRLARALAATPGVRVPGAFDGFELAVRAILGQQVTVRGASTLAGRFAARFGAHLASPFADLALLTPTAERIAEAEPREVAELGIVGRRAESIIALAREVAAGRLTLRPGDDLPTALAKLEAISGIGSWTAQYIAMRALRWPDAFPKEDMVLQKRLGDITPAKAEAIAEAWRPWRSYATMHLWASGTT